MTKLKKHEQVETAFDTYTLTEIIGEGGAGRVYGGKNSSGEDVAIKVLTSATSDKRKRFRNEVNFLLKNKHAHIVSVSESGVANGEKVVGPFYVMPRYSGNLRDELSIERTPDEALRLFSQILDGVEAAHLQDVVHRDLKPENVLIDADGKPAIADCGIARFNEEALLTAVKTSPRARLANFQYAAPEQRVAGSGVGIPADIYALGLMLNELFTGQVPFGSDYRRIADEDSGLAYLDEVVAAMIRQQPENRPKSIAAVKALIQRHRLDAVSAQKLSAVRDEVIPEGEIDDPLAFNAPQVVDARYDNGELTIKLDRSVNAGWINSLKNLGNYRYTFGIEPRAVQISGDTARLSVGRGASNVQQALDFFKSWLPGATDEYRQTLQKGILAEQARRQSELEQIRKREEENQRVNSSLKI